MESCFKDNYTEILLCGGSGGGYIWGGGSSRSGILTLPSIWSLYRNTKIKKCIGLNQHCLSLVSVWQFNMYFSYVACLFSML